MIAERFDVFLLDLDGVVYVGDTLLPGARPTLRRLREDGKTIRFLTNDPRPTRSDIAERLEGFGIEAHTREVVTCGWATAAYVSEAGLESAYVVGSEGLRQELKRAGLRLTEGEDAEAVVVGCDEQVDYSHIKHAARRIREGAQFVATNEDPTFPTPDGPAPATGAIVAAIRTAAEETPYVVGKPHPQMFEAALNGRDPAAAVMVGDQPETDILGAKRMGITALLLRREGDRPPREEMAGTPSPVIASLADLFDETTGRNE
jgi:HAD superfamily hydrolase (TIGR01450 family)